jgi:effector-binding domain-containing protein
MEIEIIHQPRQFDIYGFSAIALEKDYAGTAFQLMDKIWQTVRKNALKNKGMNIWVYESDDQVFAGVELEEAPDLDTGLEQKSINLPKYAYYKHIGPYPLIKQSGQKMEAELKEQGFEIILPYIEIYGHWTNDETKLETDLLMRLK